MKHPLAQKRPRRRTFFREWRKHRELTQEAAAERIGIEQATLSRIERGLIAYTQDFLEAAAYAYRCEPADLIMRNPLDPEAPWSIWETLPQPDKVRAVEILRGLKRASGE
ncbi:MAG: helix-turn-helix domain-containing protein [Reyranella sp.]|uniref:helix-turn-helix domain-containing protein n=1 Tax=Reyranella sp. TaxID=1929291 RepID=UPI003D0962E5